MQIKINTYRNNYLLIGILCLIFLSCSKLEKSYQQETQIRFEEAEYKTIFLPNKKSNETIKIPINIIGTSFEEDKTFQVLIFDISDDNLLSAISIQDNYTFSKISYLDSISIQINTDMLEEKSDLDFILALKSCENCEIATNYNSCKISLYKMGFIEQFIGRLNCHESTINDNYIVNFMIESNSDTSILNNNFWNFNKEYTYLKYILKKDTNLVTIPVQVWTDSADISYNVWGSGTYDMEGTIRTDYFMQIVGETDIYERGYHIFTPLR
jgi:hypothetical protein